MPSNSAKPTKTDEKTQQAVNRLEKHVGKNAPEKPRPEKTTEKPDSKSITLARKDWEDVIALMVHGIRNTGPENFEIGGRLWRLMTLQLGKES